jgi:hypothetical protein
VAESVAKAGEWLGVERVRGGGLFTQDECRELWGKATTDGGVSEAVLVCIVTASKDRQYQG